MLRIMVQGDRDATGIEDTVRALGTLCKERKIGLNVGEAGQIVRILAETGADVRVHQAKSVRPNVPEGCTNVKIVDCFTPAEKARWQLEEEVAGMCHHSSRSSRTLAWAVRLACLDTSDGFIFFPGREGTLAHLVPIMAFIAKGEVDKGVARPRRVALVGWGDAKKDALLELFDIGDDDEWVGSFTIDEMDSVVSWLVDGLPAK